MMNPPILKKMIFEDHQAIGATRERLTPMAIPIPPDFDYLKEGIDGNELVVRDCFRLKIENWAKFRHAIGVGTDDTHLQGSSISDDVRDAYRDLGKAHYEVVCSLGYCKYALLDMQFGNSFVVDKAIKDFYFHGGVLLDNLSRLIYIINDPDAVSKKNKKGEYGRRTIDRGTLIQNKSAAIATYITLIDSSPVSEFVAIRVALTHYWRIPIVNGEWPRDQLRSKAFAWPYHDPQFLKCSGWAPIPFILNEHLQELIMVQDAIFGLLLQDIATFERNNGVTIV
jgi:hypothetical protein